MSLKKLFLRTALLIMTLLIVILFGLGASAIIYSKKSYSEGDSVIVLGAAAWGNKPSPVFQARIDHAIDLFNSGNISRLYFTGGVGDGKEFSEAEVAKNYAIYHGIPTEAIFIEETSYTTLQNLVNISSFINSGEKVLIVTDPLHEKRGVDMARDLGMNAYPSPTPYTRYISLHSQADFLIREIYFTVIYKIWGK